jgi:hypothetical protein
VACLSILACFQEHVPVSREFHGADEEMLADWAMSLGVKVWRGHELVAVDTDPFGADASFNAFDGRLSQPRYGKT